MKRKVKYTKKVVKFQGREVELYSIDGSTWSTNKEELLLIKERLDQKKRALAKDLLKPEDKKGEGKDIEEGGKKRGRKKKAVSAKADKTAAKESSDKGGRKSRGASKKKAADKALKGSGKLMAAKRASRKRGRSKGA